MAGAECWWQLMLLLGLAGSVANSGQEFPASLAEKVGSWKRKSALIVSLQIGSPIYSVNWLNLCISTGVLKHSICLNNMKTFVSLFFDRWHFIAPFRVTRPKFQPCWRARALPATSAMTRQNWWAKTILAPAIVFYWYFCIAIIHKWYKKIVHKNQICTEKEGFCAFLKLYLWAST